MIFISINTAVCKNFEPPTYMDICWRDLLIWWGVIYPLANIVFFLHKNVCMMMQLQACVNFSCLKTFCTKNEHIYIYLYISGGFKIFANIYNIYIIYIGSWLAKETFKSTKKTPWTWPYTLAAWRLQLKGGCLRLNQVLSTEFKVKSSPWLPPPPPPPFQPSTCLRGMLSLANGPQTLKEFDMKN